MIGLHLIGFAALAIVGWLMLDLLRRLYESKRISEQSITVDAMWLLFGIVNSIGLVFEGYRWFVSGFVAFAIYKSLPQRRFGLLRSRDKGERKVAPACYCCASSHSANAARALTTRLVNPGALSAVSR